MVVTTATFCEELDELIENAGKVANSPAADAVKAKLQEVKVLSAKLAA